MEEKKEYISKRERTKLRRIKVWEMKLAGASIEKIARETNVEIQVVGQDLQTKYEEYRINYAESAYNACTIDLERIDKLIDSYWVAATQSGDLEAAEYILKLLQQRGKIHGYAVQKIQVQAVVREQTPEEIKIRMIELLAKREPPVVHVIGTNAQAQTNGQQTNGYAQTNGSTHNESNGNPNGKQQPTDTNR
jgi:hypothetical protein